VKLRSLHAAATIRREARDDDGGTNKSFKLSRSYKLYWAEVTVQPRQELLPISRSASMCFDVR
jgi:hypothetical protein